MLQSYRHQQPVYRLAPRHALEPLGAPAIRPTWLPLLLLVRPVVGLVWLMRGLGRLLVLVNRCGTPAARADHR
jgi:hypothetical protein